MQQLIQWPPRKHRPLPALSRPLLLLVLAMSLLVAGSGCGSRGGAPPTDAPSASQTAAERSSQSSADTVRIEGANGFTGREIFRTSTADAATGYDAYVTWNDSKIVFGYTGQDVGAPACDPAEDPGCPVYERGQSNSKYVLYYLDTDPQGTGGTTEAKSFGSQQWTLPFRADYLIQIRTDYDSSQVAGLFAWNGRVWSDQGPGALDIADNDGSKFLEFSVQRSALNDPGLIKVASWFVDEKGGRSYAYWPENAVEDLPPEGTTTGRATLQHDYGFVLIDGQTPNASHGQANRDRPFPAGYAGGPVNGNASEGQHPGRSFPFHSLGFTTSNDFSGKEVFQTSTAAATGYQAYASWDSTNLYLGYTGSDVGPGDCTIPDASPTMAKDTGSVGTALSGDCQRYETGQAPGKWLVYYLDTDPQANEQGTEKAEAYGQQRWTLPFKADYSILIRTDGVTNDLGYTGVADLKKWNGSDWVSQGPEALEIFINSTSGFAKFSVDQDSLGNPSFLKAASWFVDEQSGTSHAYWPENAPADAASPDGTTSGSVKLQHYYGFVLINGQGPNTSNGQANLDRPFVPGLTAEPVNGNSPEGHSASAPYPYHTIGFTTSNDFTSNESFRTSTRAATGYTAYASWDATNVYLGYTGSDVGGGDCARSESSTRGTTSARDGNDGDDDDDDNDNDSDPDPEDRLAAATVGDTSGRAARDSTATADTAAAADTSKAAGGDCQRYETGQSPDKYLVYYLDTDPTGSQGTDERQYHGTQSWNLPFKADYAVLIRTDGETVEGNYTGVADLWRWNGKKWISQGPHALEIFDNSTSGFLKFSVSRAALGHPDALKVAGWFFDKKHDAGYAYWPRKATAEKIPADSATTGDVTLDHYYGFDLTDGRLPGASKGKANLDREFFGSYTCPSDAFTEGGTDYGGAARPFHTVALNGSNGFTKQEVFETSTQAATGYDAYASWDKRKLYLGYTGSDIGGGDCSDPSRKNCNASETGQSPTKWLVYYLDTNPGSSHGTTTAYSDARYRDSDTLGTRQTWQLPFRADYAILVRTDGKTIKDGHTGVAEVKQWNGRAWTSRGPCALQLWDNNGSGFLELSANLSYFGNPYQLKIAGWAFGPENSYAYWPADAATDGPARGKRLRSWWGFALRAGRAPNDSTNHKRIFETSVEDQTTYSTYTLNGQRDPHEQLPAENLGRESRGSQVGPGNPELFLSWDQDNLYLSLNGGSLVEGHSDLYVALDTDPTAARDPREGSGLTAQPGDSTASRQQATYPFAANIVYQFYATNHDEARADTADAEVQNPAPGRYFRTSLDTTWASFAVPEGVRIIRKPNGAPTEVAIPWADLGSLAEGDYFHLLAYLVDSGNGVDAQWPPQNPNGSAVTLTHFRSYYLQSGAEPFSNASLSVRETGGTKLSETLYGNVYLVPASAQTTTLGANTTVLNELYVGREATLAVGNNARTPSGFNRLRIGRRLTARGAFQSKKGRVVTFDPAVGYPQAQQPGGGFAATSAPTEIRCNVTFYDLTLRNETTLCACPGAQERSHVVVRDSLRLAAGGLLNTSGNHLDRSPATPSRRSAPTTRTASTTGSSGADTSSASASSTADDQASGSLIDRIVAYFHRNKKE